MTNIIQATLSNKAHSALVYVSAGYIAQHWSITLIYNNILFITTAQLFTCFPVNKHRTKISK